MSCQSCSFMTKFDLLLQQAEVSARRALIGTREQLRPLFHMIHTEGKKRVAGVPWRDAGEKETTHALVRALMRAGDVVVYSILTEAWSATPPEGWKPGEPLLMAKSEGPHRLEVVIAAAAVAAATPRCGASSGTRTGVAPTPWPASTEWPPGC